MINRVVGFYSKNGVTCYTNISAPNCDTTISISVNGKPMTLEEVNKKIKEASKPLQERAVSNQD